MKIQHLTTITESQKPKETLTQERLKYKRKDLAPTMSEATLDYHFGKLAKAYVDRFNAGEGDADFNRGGAVLHNIFFAQFEPSRGSNPPNGASQEFITKHFGSWDEFKEQFAKTAMGIQGSGWVYLDRSGKIKTIVNHKVTGDPAKIVLLVDWWEHAWALDYQADKARYLKNIWKIIDWSVINNRLQGA